MWGNKMIEDIRKIVTYEEIINVEGGKKDLEPNNYDVELVEESTQTDFSDEGYSGEDEDALVFSIGASF